MQQIISVVKSFLSQMDKDHVGAYAAQSAYFVMLSFIPFIMMLLTLIQYTPVTKSDFLKMAVDLMPPSIDPLIILIIDEVYGKSATILSITALVAAWTAGKGMLAITKGLNTIYNTDETRNYFILRIRAAAYMLVFVIALVLSLVFIVFGNKLFVYIGRQYPLISELTYLMNRIKGVFVLIFLMFAFLAMYKFLPDKKVKVFEQLPGAMFAAAGWIAFSFGFSVYINFSSGFANMYGSLTTIIFIMLWLYSLMYIMLIGAEVNVLSKRLRKEGWKA